MDKKQYSKPAVLSHEAIRFETLLSCSPPKEPATGNNQGPVCLNPDGTWYPR